MARDSFKEDVIINDPEKAKEIVYILKQPHDKFIQFSQPDPLPKNANEIWFKKEN